MSDLVESVSIASLASQCAIVVERVRQVLDLLDEVQKPASGAHIDFPRLVIDNSYSRHGTVCVMGDYVERDEAETCILHTIDTEGWNYLPQESGLRTLMDTTVRDTWAKQVAEGEVPELTAASIEATFGQLYEACSDMFECGVPQYFCRLSWDYKTNQPFKLGERVIVTGLMTGGYAGSRATNELDDLMRVSHVLNGQPEADRRNGMHAPISGAWHERRREAENVYLHLRWFKNGNGHATFKRPDLVDKLNLILVKHYPAALAAERRW